MKWTSRLVCEGRVWPFENALFLGTLAMLTPFKGPSITLRLGPFILFMNEDSFISVVVVVVVVEGIWDQ